MIQARESMSLESVKPLDHCSCWLMGSTERPPISSHPFTDLGSNIMALHKTLKEGGGGYGRTHWERLSFICVAGPLRATKWNNPGKGLVLQMCPLLLRHNLNIHRAWHDTSNHLSIQDNVVTQMNRHLFLKLKQSRKNNFFRIDRGGKSVARQTILSIYHKKLPQM